MGVIAEDLSPAKEMYHELDAKMKKYLRGDVAHLEDLKDKMLKGQLKTREAMFGEAAKVAAKTEKWLLPSEGGFLEAEGMERTWKFKQEDIFKEVDILSKRSQYDIVIPDLGPYRLHAKWSVYGSSRAQGHIAILDMRNMSLIKELQVKETVRDVVCLHNELFFAAAQKKYPYIYNRDGVEVHCLKKHGTVRRLHFLKHHFLLASINKFGQLHYQDVSVGKMVGNLRTGFGRTDVMKVNPYNGVVALGHSNGTVTTWKPTVQIPLVKMLCHAGPVSALAFHPNGHLMATSGKERKIKIWDPRKFEVYSRYMNHSIVKGYQITDIMFRPYEDVLGVGHSMGWSCILIPGSGEANFDSWVANPFEMPKQRREREIRALLDKLPPETIMLDPTKIGTVKDPRHKEKRTKKEIEEELEAVFVVVVVVRTYS